MKLRYICWFIAIVIVLSSVQAYAERNQLTVALIHTFSKPDPQCYDPYGKSLLNAIAMAWEDFQQEHPTLSFNVKFVRYDMADNRRRAIEMMTEASRDGAAAAIGYICSDFAILGGQRAQELGIPMITPGATDDRIAEIGPYVFMASFINSYQGKVLARYAHDQLKLKHTLIIKSVDCSYCTSLASAYKIEFEKAGGDIVAELEILSKDRDFKEVALQAKQYNADSILLPNYAMQTAGIIAAIRNVGIDPIFLGGDSWLWTEEAYDIIGDKPFSGYSVAGWVPEYPTKKSRDFVKRYERRYGAKVVDTAAHSYDAAIFLFKALENARSYDRSGIMDALSRVRLMNGVTGSMVFDKNRYPHRSLAVMKTSNGKQELVKIIEPN